jgi:hypothetical protein
MTKELTPRFGSGTWLNGTGLLARKRARSLQLLPPRSRLDEWMGWGLLLLCSLIVVAGVWQMASELNEVPQRCAGVLSTPVR